MLNQVFQEAPFSRQISEAFQECKVFSDSYMILTIPAAVKATNGPTLFRLAKSGTWNLFDVSFAVQEVLFELVLCCTIYTLSPKRNTFCRTSFINVLNDVISAEFDSNNFLFQRLK